MTNKQKLQALRTHLVQDLVRRDLLVRSETGAIFATQKTPELTNTMKMINQIGQLISQES